MPQDLSDLTMTSFRGGMNDSVPAQSIADDQVVRADDVEFFFSMLGERRAGCDPLDLTGAGFGTLTSLVHLSQWYPTNDVTNAELWAFAATPGTPGIAVAAARRSGVSGGNPTWNPVTFVVGHIPLNSIPEVYQIRQKSINAKNFFAYAISLAASQISTAQANNDRFHVWDGGGAVRMTGFRQSTAPASAVDEGSGSFSGNRYYRQRWVQLNSAGTVVRRSEPSIVGFTFTPSGSGAGATVTRGNGIGELETHWELEASLDNANFYRIATIPSGTLTFNDENASYAGTFTLSEAIGAYLTQPAARFVAADGDRLLLAGHQFDPARQSYVWWSPRLADPGVGNDERQPIVDTGGANINTFKNLDGVQGGPVTGLSNGVNGSFYVFKWQRIYKMTATDDITNAYSEKLLTDQQGAIPDSVFEGVDEAGRACVYFLDPMYGPSRIGTGGIQTIEGLRGTWKRVNAKAAKKAACGVFYPFKRQARWWVAADGNDLPSLGLCNQVSENRWMDHGAIRGCWSRFTGTLASALCASLYNEWVKDTAGNITLSERPFIGLTTPRNLVQRCDVDTTDDGQTIPNPIILTKPYIMGLLQNWGAMTGTMLATAQAGTTVNVRVVRDFGLETNGPYAVSTAPVGTESMVIVDIDNMIMSQARAIQLQFSDT